MGSPEPLAPGQNNVDPASMLVAYRHDTHKLHRQPHNAASKTFAGVPVNRPVPLGADEDASALSRPGGEPEQTMESHEMHYRLSLVTGETQVDPTAFNPGSFESDLRNLLTEEDPGAMHQKWLSTEIVSAYNESVYYPYTSLKYHTLLVASLLDNYRAGHSFGDLYLVVDPADEIVPHRTIYAGDKFALRVDGSMDDQPSVHLGPQPWRSWAPTWNELTEHPLETSHDKDSMVLDANLRRIGAWSTALQYIEDWTVACDQ